MYFRICVDRISSGFSRLAVSDIDFNTIQLFKCAFIGLIAKKKGLSMKRLFDCLQAFSWSIAFLIRGRMSRGTVRDFFQVFVPFQLYKEQQRFILYHLFHSTYLISQETLELTLTTLRPEVTSASKLVL